MSIAFPLLPENFIIQKIAENEMDEDMTILTLLNVDKEDLQQEVTNWEKAHRETVATSNKTEVHGFFAKTNSTYVDSDTNITTEDEDSDFDYEIHDPNEEKEDSHEGNSDEEVSGWFVDPKEELRRQKQEEEQKKRLQQFQAKADEDLARILQTIGKR